MEGKDLYAILGLESCCTVKEVRSSFRRLSRRFHPDKCRGGEKLYGDIMLAYSVLSDPNLREEYDALRGAKEEAPTFMELREASRKPLDLDLSRLANDHRSQVESRHKHLLHHFRERTLPGVKAERTSLPPPPSHQKQELRVPPRRRREGAAALIEVRHQPAPAPQKWDLERYQVLSRLGEMYYAGEEEPPLRGDFLSEVTREEWLEMEDRVRRMPPVASSARSPYGSEPCASSHRGR